MGTWNPSVNNYIFWQTNTSQLSEKYLKTLTTIYSQNISLLLKSQKSELSVTLLSIEIKKYVGYFFRRIRHLLAANNKAQSE